MFNIWKMSEKEMIQYLKEMERHIRMQGFISHMKECEKALHSAVMIMEKRPEEKYLLTFSLQNKEKQVLSFL